MFSLPYFKYLIKSKKVLILIIALWTIIGAVFNSDLMGEDLAVLSYSALTGKEVFLCYSLPPILLSFVHDKRAVDTYFSTSVSRKSILFTTIIFGLAVIFGTFTIGFLITAISASLEIAKIFTVLGVSLLCFVTVLMFNTLIYLSANNNVDGLVMEAAYFVLPLAIYGVCSGFAETYVYGGYAQIANDLIYLSLPINVTNIITKAYDFSLLSKTLYSWVMVLITLFASTYVAFKNFINRKVERAGTTSDRLFTYPFNIYVYTVVILFGIICLRAFDFDYKLVEFVKDAAILYLLTFILFVVAHFLYKRKFYINVKMPAFFICAMIATLLISEGAIKTEGFGLSNVYTVASENVRYEFGYYSYRDGNNECAQLIDKLKNDYFLTFNEEIGKIESYSIFVVANGENIKISDKALTIIDSYRKKAIEDHFNKVESTASGILTVRENTNASSLTDFLYIPNYRYEGVRMFTLEEIMILSKEQNIIITIDVSVGEDVIEFNIENGSTKINPQKYYEYEPEEYTDF